jgi:hypothetical protein
MGYLIIEQKEMLPNDTTDWWINSIADTTNKADAVRLATFGAATQLFNGIHGTRTRRITSYATLKFPSRRVYLIKVQRRITDDSVFIDGWGAEYLGHIDEVDMIQSKRANELCLIRMVANKALGEIMNKHSQLAQFERLFESEYTDLQDARDELAVAIRNCRSYPKLHERGFSK